MAWRHPGEPDEICSKAGLPAGAGHPAEPPRERGSGTSGAGLGLLAWSRCSFMLPCACSTSLPSEQFLNGC